MNDLSIYYGAIRQEQAALEEKFPENFLYVTSVKNLRMNSTAGSVAQMSTRMAAQHIVDGTGRPSTKEESDKFLEAGRLYNAKISAANEKLNPTLGRVILMPSDARATK